MVTSGFETIIGQQRPITILQHFLATTAVPHALLFTGIEGVGKRTTAKLFAMALNCRNVQPLQSPSPEPYEISPCGTCRSCRHITDGIHPDMIQINPQKNTIRIAQIRTLLGMLAMKPYNATHRVVIIAQADCMNREAGNALLKILEEPPPDTILILTAQCREDLLPTIASRCRHIRFNALATDDVVRLLSRHSDVDPSQRQTIAQLAGGSYTRALIIAQSQWNRHRDWVIRAAGLDRAEHLKDRNAALALAFSKALADEKAHIEDNITLLQTWIRDLAIIVHTPQNAIHRDRLETLQQVRAGLDSDTLLGLWNTVEKAQKNIVGNGNLRLTLDVMALQMATLLAA